MAAMNSIVSTSLNQLSDGCKKLRADYILAELQIERKTVEETAIFGY